MASEPPGPIPSRLTAALADHYLIERELGAGGMATVYLAEDLKHHRKVAVKVLRPDLAASLGPERFLREVTIAANLQHPHVLPLYDSGQADGFLYYVMPYVEGTNLRQKLIREGELPIAEAVRILRDMADAMAYAHQHGVVHRDIKPENVMLSGRHALVTDFGVAKAVSQATGRQTLTTAGVALGTPTYMSPGAGGGGSAHRSPGGHLRASAWWRTSCSRGARHLPGRARRRCSRRTSRPRPIRSRSIGRASRRSWRRW